ncbi:hypothetical protein [Chthoniobacter flavus]|uniref:hypothetical protein n=1 Tax=Chthoniobacter flavus TaxID=191863 RepID=UPI0005B26D16|nr:hypothetical protein [Chthoniobacter flavus]
MSEIEHPELLDELRQKIRNGESAVDAMHFLIDRLRLGPDSRLIVIMYFRAAFDLKLPDASTLGAWQFFTGANWPDEVVNAEIAPMLARYFEQGA